MRDGVPLVVPLLKIETLAGIVSPHNGRKQYIRKGIYVNINRTQNRELADARYGTMTPFFIS